MLGTLTRRFAQADPAHIQIKDIRLLHEGRHKDLENR
jgi:hypothetical protein